MKINKNLKKTLFLINIINTLALSGCGSWFTQDHPAPITQYKDTDSDLDLDSDSYQDINKNTNQNKKSINKQKNHTHKNNPKIYFSHNNQNIKSNSHPKQKKLNHNDFKNKKTKYTNHKTNQNKHTQNKHTQNKKTKFIFKNNHIHKNHLKTNSSLIKTHNGWVLPTTGKHYQKNLITYFTDNKSRPVYSATNGTVIFSGEGVQPFKNMVIISKKNSSINTIYGNLSKIYIKEGQYIKQGYKIGSLSKNNGTLLFQIRKSGKAISSAKYIISNSY